MKLLIPITFFSLLLCACAPGRITAGSQENNVPANTGRSVSNTSNAGNAPRQLTNQPVLQHNESTEVYRSNADTSRSSGRFMNTQTK